MTDLLKVVELGLDAQKFLNTNLGRYLYQRALQEVEERLAEMKTVKPTDSEHIAQLQFDIRVAEQVFIWLDNAINEGVAAEQQTLQQQE